MQPRGPEAIKRQGRELLLLGWSALLHVIWICCLGFSVCARIPASRKIRAVALRETSWTSPQPGAILNTGCLEFRVWLHISQHELYMDIGPLAPEAHPQMHLTPLSPTSPHGTFQELEDGGLNIPSYGC